MHLRRVTAWLSLAIQIATVAPPVHAQEDTDVRQPIVVKTKRASLTSRTLPHLIDLTEEHSPNVLAARDTFQAAKLDYEIKNRAWFPSLDISTTDGLLGTDPNTRPGPWSSQMDLTLTQNIYDNGTAFTNFEIAGKVLARAKIEYEQARDQQLLNMANAYYDWSASVKQRDVLENKRDLLRRQFNVLEAQYKQGLKNKRDVIRIETEIRRLELDVISGDNDIDLNFQKLAAFVGLQRQELEGEDIEAEDAKPYSSKEAPTIELKAENHRIARINAYKNTEANLATYLVQRTYWPQVSIAGEAGYHNTDFLANPAAPTWETDRHWDWSALLTIKYNLWDFGALSRKVEQARVKEHAIVETNAQALLDLQNQLRDVNNQLRAFNEQVRLTRELLVLEQQSYSILEAEYRNGRATYLDLITNLNSLIDARSRYNAAYFGLKKQQANYAFHRGELYDTYKDHE